MALHKSDSTKSHLSSSPYLPPIYHLSIRTVAPAVEKCRLCSPSMSLHKSDSTKLHLSPPHLLIYLLLITYQSGRSRQWFTKVNFAHSLWPFTRLIRSNRTYPHPSSNSLLSLIKPVGRALGCPLPPPMKRLHRPLRRSRALVGPLNEPGP